MKILKYPDYKPVDIDRGKPLKWSWWNDEIILDSGKKVIFNTLHRSAILVPQDFSPDSDEDMLRTLGMLVDCDIDEVAQFGARYVRAKKDMGYLDLTVLATNRCQFRCVYCFEGVKTHETLTEKTMDDVMSYLNGNIGVCRKLRVTWFGGEPLLGYSQIQVFSDRLIRFCETNGIAYSADITSNGYALTRARCHELVHRLKVRRFIITVDGMPEVHDGRRPLADGHGTFDKIWDNINLLIGEGAYVTLRMTIDRENADSVIPFLDKLAESGVAGKIGLSFCRTIDFGFTPHSIKGAIYSEAEFADVEWRFIQYARSRGLLQLSFPHAAPAGGCLRDGDIVIGANGEIYKCLDTLGDHQWITGHISEHHSHDKPKWYKDWLQWTPVQNPVCRACKLIPLCSGGCPHNALFSSKMHGTESQCPDWKSNYRRMIKTIAEKYEETI